MKSISDKSCLRCRKKKVKCNKNLPACQSCDKKQLQCDYPTISKARGLKKGYIRELELKLFKIKELLENTKGLPNDLTNKFLEITKNGEPLSKKKKTSHGSETDSKIESLFETKKLSPKKALKPKKNFLLLGTDKTKKYFGESSAPFSLIQPLSQDGVYKAPDMDKIPNPNAKIEDIDKRLSFKVVKHIISSYFKYMHPFFPIVDPGIIIDNMRNYTDISSLYSKSFPKHLFYAIASNSYLSAEENHYYNNINMLKLQCDCYEMAKVLMRQHIFHPTFQNIQTLLILSIATNPRNKYDEWCYSGTAIRMATMLGLHKNILPRTTRPDYQAQKNIWWGCYVVDKMMALCFGRPPFIFDRDYDVEEITPGIHLNNPEHVRYICNHLCVDDFREAFDNYHFIKNIQLCKIIGRTITTVYTKKTLETSCISALHSKIKDIDTELLKHFEGLNSNYQQDKTVKNSFDLSLRNVFYCSIKISLYKPYLRRVRNKETKSVYLEKLYNISSSMITSVCENLQTYAKSCVVLKLYPVLLALSVFITKYTLEIVPKDEHVLWILKCVKIIHSMKYQTFILKKIVAALTSIFFNTARKFSEMFEVYPFSEEVKNIIFLHEHLPLGKSQLNAFLETSKDTASNKKDKRTNPLKAGCKKSAETLSKTTDDIIGFNLKYSYQLNPTTTSVFLDNENSFLNSIYGNLYDTNFFGML